MSGQSNQYQWWELSVQLLLGIVSGLVATVAAVLLFKGLYAVSFAVANQIDNWLAFGAFVTLLLMSTILSGIGAGVAGSLVGGIIAWQRWRPSRRWFFGWGSTWIIGGIGLWMSYIQAVQANPSLNLASSSWWVLLGLIIALAFALIAPPWRSIPARG